MRTGRSTTSNAPVGRLAPSPTGAFHLGNARTFLATWLSIRSRGGHLVLRIEDLDHPKVKPWAVREAINDLHWLGLDWDSGPQLQTNRISLYATALDRLNRADLVYPCTCSRRDVETAQSAPHAGDDGPRYPGTCAPLRRSFEEAAQTLPLGRIPAWRFRVNDSMTTFDDDFSGPQTECVAATTGDFVLARHRDGAGYMLAVVTDDAEAGITEVMRGDDLLSATHRQVHVQAALGIARPRYVHLPLVVAPDGRRLAKRHGDTRIATLRERGVRPESVIGLLAWWSGWAKYGESVTASALIPRYTLDTIPREPAVLTDSVRCDFEI